MPLKSQLSFDKCSLFSLVLRYLGPAVQIVVNVSFDFYMNKIVLALLYPYYAVCKQTTDFYDFQIGMNFSLLVSIIQSLTG